MKTLKTKQASSRKYEVDEWILMYKIFITMVSASALKLTFEKINFLG